ncbi:MAG: efflux RND transporter periplasmic adaptor subunit [Candidatus Peribacteraceae bacterium]|nr:efflux RND transporter periplasmic adaptor subunit [Candidatus Peribacteraceae bacterium]MDD5742556.1 efflux RND transporter periplasmic adaptor subunit [Candidatus Peribacteraceae bacterium]
MEQIVLPSQAQQPKPSIRVIQWMRRFVRQIHIRSYLTGLGVMAILGVSYFAFAQNTSQTTTATTGSYVNVERQTLSSSVKATGTVAFGSEQELKFNSKGTIAKVNFEEGDTVKKDQVIAELDKVSALADIQLSQLAIAAGKLQLEQLIADREASALTAQNAVNSAERSVSQAESDLAKTRETELQSLASTAQDIIIGSEKLLDSFYGVLTNATVARPPADITTLDIDRHLYRDWTLKNAVEINYREGVNQATAMRQKYGTGLNSEQDAAVILQALEDGQSLAETLQKLGEQTYSLMQGASTDSITFTVDELTTLRSTVNTNRSTAAGLVDDARTAQSSLVALTTKESIPSTTLQTKEDTLTTYQESQLVKEVSLKSTLKSLDTTIEIKRNDLTQKAVSLSKLYKTLEDYRLVAPFDGVITHLDYKVGDNLLETGDTESLTLQNPSYILITIPLDQVDVVRVQKGMTGSIVFDAIPGQTFKGVVDSIDSTAVTTSGVVSYNVDVKLPTPSGVTILSGMTTTVTIETSRKENVLMVPTLALHTEGGDTTVQTTLSGSVIVTTGVTNGQYTEIVSGLKEGDSVLSVNLGTSTASASTSATGNNSMQLMRTLDGGGGGGGPPR